ncbi:MAG: hypothetical protein JWM16_5904, partial [Verrucomicrobiales bacterium]|nr:hypothetical protein [Verrucomicrobiales bacterium]
MNVTEIIAHLETKGGFRHAPVPIHIYDVEFSFDAILTGPDASSGLVLVHEVKNSTAAILLRRMNSLCVALERT